MKKILFNSLFVFGALLISCKKQEIIPPPAATSNLTNYFDDNRDAAIQTFSINASTSNQFTGSNGVIVTVPANAFTYANGNPVTGTITMNLIEILDQSSMILMGMPTTSNGEILVSGGQINLTAMQGSTPVYLTNGSVSVMVPTSNFDSQMALFEGIENSEGDVDWILSVDDSTSMPDSLGFVPDSSGGFFGGYYYFDWSDSTMGWINCDYFYADPNPLTSLTADMSSDYNSSNTAAYLHFSSINSVASLYHSGGDFSASGIPEGMAVTVVCISEISGNYYSAFVPVTVTTNIIVPITMTATTLADFEAAVANL
jgi:hypothetical protein